MSAKRSDVKKTDCIIMGCSECGRNVWHVTCIIQDKISCDRCNESSVGVFATCKNSCITICMHCFNQCALEMLESAMVRHLKKMGRLMHKPGNERKESKKNAN